MTSFLSVVGLLIVFSLIVAVRAKKREERAAKEEELT